MGATEQTPSAEEGHEMRLKAWKLGWVEIRVVLVPQSGGIKPVQKKKVEWAPVKPQTMEKDVENMMEIWHLCLFHPFIAPHRLDLRFPSLCNPSDEELTTRKCPSQSERRLAEPPGQHDASETLGDAVGWRNSGKTVKTQHNVVKSEL